MVIFFIKDFLAKIEKGWTKTEEIEHDVTKLKEFRANTENQIMEINVNLKKLSEMAVSIQGINDIKDGLKRINDRMDDHFKLLIDQKEKYVEMSVRCLMRHTDKSERPRE